MKNFSREILVKNILPIALSAPILFCISCFADNKLLAQGYSNSKKTGCEITTLKKSSAMIALILNDVNASYAQVGGGGITNIKLIRSDVFVVSIAQEERIDQITYEMTIDKSCNAKILKRD